MKVKVGDKVKTDGGEGIIAFIGTYLVVYRDENGIEWTEDSYCLSAAVSCEIDFMKMTSKKEKK